MMRVKARILLMLTVGCVMALPVTLPEARDAGREYPRCVHACNVARQNCDGRCGPDCTVLYPNPGPERRACEGTCHDVCVEQEQDCKARCLAIKKGETSPNEP